LSLITLEEFEELINEDDKISAKEAKEIKKKFIAFRKAAEARVIKYDSKWIQQHALSLITLEKFEELIDGDETISMKKTKEIKQQFIALRKAAEAAKINYDSEWIEK